MGEQLILFGLPPTLEQHRERTLASNLAHVLGDALDRPLEVRVAASYSELADDLAEGKLDFAWLPPLEAMTLARHCGSEIIAQADRGGEGGYYSVLFVPADCGISSLDALHEKALAFVHRRSASGYLAVASMLAKSGIRPEHPPRFYGSHAKVVEAVVAREVVAGATFATYSKQPTQGGELLISGWEQAAGKQRDACKVIAWAGPIPADTICAWAGTTSADRAAMSTSLTALGKNKKETKLLESLFGARRLIPASVQDYHLLDEAFERLLEPLT